MRHCDNLSIPPSHRTFAQFDMLWRRGQHRDRRRLRWSWRFLLNNGRGKGDKLQRIPQGIEREELVAMRYVQSVRAQKIEQRIVIALRFDISNCFTIPEEIPDGFFYAQSFGPFLVR